MFTVHEIDSSCLELVAYNAASRLLRLTFKGGNTYDYYPVPGETVRDFLRAGSRGKFYRESIKGHYESVRLEPEENDRYRKEVERLKEIRDIDRAIVRLQRRRRELAEPRGKERIM
jgi:hypothetical protein